MGEYFDNPMNTEESDSYSYTPPYCPVCGQGEWDDAEGALPINHFPCVEDMRKDLRHQLTAFYISCRDQKKAEDALADLQEKVNEFITLLEPYIKGGQGG